jgi:hypothetical protein
MGRRRREYEATLVAKASEWLAQELDTTIHFLTEVAQLREPPRDKIKGPTLSKHIENQHRLALALEVYGEAVRGGDRARIEVALRELEMPAWKERRSEHWYHDPIELLDYRRRTRRLVARKRKELEALRAQGARPSEIRKLERTIEGLQGYPD